MKRSEMIALAVTTNLLLGGSADRVIAQGVQPASASTLAEKIDEIVDPYVEARDFMGVVAVRRDGEAAVIRSCGLASVELNLPHRNDDIFMIGSISKQFTAVAVLLLEEDGALKTSDFVSRHLPAFAHGDSVTIEQLLTHTSGIIDIYSLERFGETAGREGSFDEVLDDLGRVPLTHVPGTAYAYSNGGYALLAAIIEQTSGMPYGEFLTRRVFERLKMTSTAHDGPGPAVAHRVPGYDPWGTAALTPVSPISPAYSTGSGSLWSSAADLLTWTSAIHTGRLLSDASVEKLTRDYGHAYGYGVSVFTRFGRPVVGHDGRVIGYASDAARYVDDRVSVVILGNVQSVARDEIRHLVAAAALGETPLEFDERVYEDHAPDLGDLVGVYGFGPGFEVSISEAQGRLLARANEGGYSELVPTRDGEWFSRMLYATVRFGRAETGAVDRLIWGRGDGAPVGMRIR